MKQTITIMAAFMVALLLVSGFIVMGSMQQSQLLATRAEQLAQTRSKLNEQVAINEELNQAADTLSKSLEEMTLERDGLALRLEDALGAVEEANGAVDQQVTDLEAAKADYALEKDALVASLSEQQTLSDALDQELREVKTERDTLASRVETLEAEAVKLNDQLTQTGEAGRRLSALEGECKAFQALLICWNDARLGRADAKELDTLTDAFGKAYPKSTFALPELGRGETVTPTDAGGTTLPSPTPAPANTPAPAPEGLAPSAPAVIMSTLPPWLPLRTLAPTVTPSL